MRFVLIFISPEMQDNLGHKDEKKILPPELQSHGESDRTVPKHLHKAVTEDHVSAVMKCTF